MTTFGLPTTPYDPYATGGQQTTSSFNDPAINLTGIAEGAKGAAQAGQSVLWGLVETPYSRTYENPMFRTANSTPIAVDLDPTSVYSPTAPTAPTTTSPQTPATGGTAPVTTTGGMTYEPTIGEQLTGIKSEALRIQEILNQRQAEEAGGAYMMPGINIMPSYEDIYGEPVDEEAINAATLKMFQDQIDATNQVYDQLLNEARLEGEGRLGSQRAIAARGGLLGSDFAGAQKARVQNYNTDIYRSIGAERSAAIGAIHGTARQAAASEIAAKRAARQQGAENYLNYLSNSQANRLNNINSVAQAFLAQGLDPNDMDDTEIASIASEIGAQPADIITAYQGLQAEAQDGTDYGFMSTTGGIFRTDPATGEATFIPSGGGTSSTSAGGYTTTQRNKLEQAGLLNASREEQLDYLYGDGADKAAEEQLAAFLELNKNLDPEILKQRMLEEGFSVTLTNSYLQTRPMSDVDVRDMAVSLVSNTIEPSFWQSRSTELEEAKANAIAELTEAYQAGELIDLFGERSKQLTPEEFRAVVNTINSFEGRDTANELIGN